MVASLLAVSAGFVAAQDAAPAAGTVQCDSDLILNLYIAERFFGFTRVQQQIQASGADTSTWVDLNTIDKGQYTPWFNGQMVATTDGAITLNDQQIGTLTSTLMMDSATRQQMMDSVAAGTGTDMTTINPLPQTSVGAGGGMYPVRTELILFQHGCLQDFSGALSAMPRQPSTDMSAVTATLL
jgi:hypothetical protein